jgi:hypothetical protein
MAKFLIALLLIGAVAAGFLIYTKKNNIPVLPKTPAERWVDSLPPEQGACVREKVGITLLNDIQNGKVMDTDIRTVVTAADCGVVWNDTGSEM